MLHPTEPHWPGFSVLLNFYFLIIYLPKNEHVFVIGNNKHANHWAVCKNAERYKEWKENQLNPML